MTWLQQTHTHTHTHENVELNKIKALHDQKMMQHSGQNVHRTKNKLRQVLYMLHAMFN